MQAQVEGRREAVVEGVSTAGRAPDQDSDPKTHGSREGVSA
ncbi:hypothetical protein EDD40_1761 [Saccharothrix texasensis]|uniref:Uncharacterized protein n=1 Tax=Saccharothrix texasensis TaxID=103734 RepID=A0A3N1H1Y4_9PSEU|nr:hypothetical protein EDD40_1761 [Saccharothrix texasensis]